MKYYSEIKRSIPALGTFFEIKCLSEEQDFDKTQNLLTKSFSKVRLLESKLSFHDEESDLSEINQLAQNDEMMICRELALLLRASSYLNRISGNIFNIIKPHKPRISTDQYFRLKNNRIKILKKSELDLGGIAKGFIVDKIVKFLIQNGIDGGIVNGGGDIRVFGNYNAPIHIRDPFDFRKNIAIGNYSDHAIASSCITENSKNRGGKSEIYDSNSSDIIHATVIGKTCTICDALTKVGLIDPEISAKLLKKINYRGIMINKSGQTFMTE